MPLEYVGKHFSHGHDESAHIRETRLSGMTI